jgi:hypothetical protein
MTLDDALAVLADMMLSDLESREALLRAYGATDAEVARELECARAEWEATRCDVRRQLQAWQLEGFPPVDPRVMPALGTLQ